jgi:hypothetical protein
MIGDHRTTKRNDRHDVDATELRLIRVGHHVWRLYRRESYPDENGPLWEALQAIWAAKRERRRQLSLMRAAETEGLRQKFRSQDKLQRPQEWPFLGEVSAQDGV